MKFSKTAKKINNNVKKALKVVETDIKSDNIEAFAGFSHSCQWDNFPASLVILCQFETPKALAQAEQDQRLSYFQKNIHKQLLKVGIVLKDVRQNVKLTLALESQSEQQ